MSKDSWMQLMLSSVAGPVLFPQGQAEMGKLSLIQTHGGAGARSPLEMLLGRGIPLLGCVIPLPSFGNGVL